MLWWLTRSKRLVSLNTESKEVIQRGWQKIEQWQTENTDHSLKSALLEADKLVDFLMRERQAVGNTFAERFKWVRGRLSRSNDCWWAHTLRNKIAHETDVKIGGETLRRAIGHFRQALKDLGGVQ